MDFDRVSRIATKWLLTGSVIAIIVVGIVSLTGCAGAADKLADVVSDFDEKHMESVVERVKVYCLTVPEGRRAANRVTLDLGKGPILMAHCDRLP